MQRAACPSVLDGSCKSLYELHQRLVIPLGNHIFRLLTSSPRVTVVGGDQDQVVRALLRDKLYSSSQVLPTIYIKSRCLNQFYVTPLTLTSC